MLVSRWTTDGRKTDARLVEEQPGSELRNGLDQSRSTRQRDRKGHGLHATCSFLGQIRRKYCGWPGWRKRHRLSGDGRSRQARISGHHGHLVFAMVGRHFLSEDELVDLLARGPTSTRRRPAHSWLRSGREVTTRRAASGSSSGKRARTFLSARIPTIHAHATSIATCTSLTRRTKISRSSTRKPRTPRTTNALHLPVANEILHMNCLSEAPNCQGAVAAVSRVILMNASSRSFFRYCLRATSSCSVVAPRKPDACSTSLCRTCSF